MNSTKLVNPPNIKKAHRRSKLHKMYERERIETMKIPIPEISNQISASILFKRSRDIQQNEIMMTIARLLSRIESHMHTWVEMQKGGSYPIDEVYKSDDEYDD